MEICIGTYEKVGVFIMEEYMNKEELITLINTLSIEEVQNFKIEYYSDATYGYQDDRAIRKIEFTK